MTQEQLKQMDRDALKEKIEHLRAVELFDPTVSDELEEAEQEAKRRLNN